MYQHLHKQRGEQRPSSEPRVNRTRPHPKVRIQHDANQVRVAGAPKAPVKCFKCAGAHRISECLKISDPSEVQVCWDKYRAEQADAKAVSPRAPSPKAAAKTGLPSAMKAKKSGKHSHGPRAIRQERHTSFRQPSPPKNGHQTRFCLDDGFDDESDDEHFVYAVWERGSPADARDLQHNGPLEADLEDCAIAIAQVRHNLTLRDPIPAFRSPDSTALHYFPLPNTSDVFADWCFDLSVEPALQSMYIRELRML